MGHEFLSQWIDLDRRLSGLQEFPVVLKFRSVYLGPRLDQTRLRVGPVARKALVVDDGDPRRMVLVVRVKVGRMMLPAASTNIRMTMPKNRESSGTLTH